MAAHPIRTTDTLFNFHDIGPANRFEYSHSRAGRISQRTGTGLRASVSLPALTGAPYGAQPARAGAAAGSNRKAPPHTLPPLYPIKRPPSSVFARELQLDLLSSPARVARMRSRHAPVEAPPWQMVDVRQDPIALYIRRKHKR